MDALSWRGAFTQAAAYVLTHWGEREDGFDAYQYLLNCIEQGVTPQELVAWQPFSELSWSAVADQITKEALVIMSKREQVACIEDAFEMVSQDNASAA